MGGLDKAGSSGLGAPHRLDAVQSEAIWIERAVDALAIALKAALDAKPDGQIWFAAAGGKTPEPILQGLALKTLPWERIVITPSDDRLVPEDHPARNLTMLRGAFAASWAAEGPESGPIFQPLDSMHQRQSPDVVLLGFGQDCHIASLFPDGEGMADALNRDHKDAWARTFPDPPPPEAPYPRVSLTLGAILRARAILVAASGKAKRASLEIALADVQGEDESKAQTLSPLARLLRQSKVPVAVFLCVPA